ncbi:MAG: rhodanese-like domain-containing protein [Corynebacterium sp.]|nr:rhodanese-like domain-containing protein [Corynebacterium sp.]
MREVQPSQVPAGATIIDVREPAEYEEVHATGAELIPLGTLTDNLDRFNTDTEYYVICRSGARSAKAVEFLESHGISATNIAGGTLGWVAAELPHS